MNLIVVGDTLSVLHPLTDAIQQSYPNADLSTFTKPDRLTQLLSWESYDAVFLDADALGDDPEAVLMPLVRLQPTLNLIFLYTPGQFDERLLTVHASGYLRKPVTPEAVAAELKDLRYPVPVKQDVLLRVRRNGYFEVFDATGSIVRFHRSKSKETLAYLIYRQGASCTIRDIAAILFEDIPYNSRQQGYLQKIFSTLVQDLKAVHAEGVLQKRYNSLSVNMERIGEEPFPASTAHGKEFMAQYSWALPIQE